VRSTNQKQELPVAVMFVNGSEINEQLYRGPSKDASYQILIHLAKRLPSQAIIFSDWLIYKNLFLCNCLAK
jgi:hypothetical protein